MPGNCRLQSRSLISACLGSFFDCLDEPHRCICRIVLRILLRPVLRIVDSVGDQAIVLSVFEHCDEESCLIQGMSSISVYRIIECLPVQGNSYYEFCSFPFFCLKGNCAFMLLYNYVIDN